jgi:dihydrofolate synthase/folylpolyglutamate synthase
MQFCGENISDEDLAEITEYVKPYADSMEDKPTEFELITAIGFEYFKRKKCDVVILEAGMGGRLDSTNIIKSSLLSVITGISLDHTAFLGDTVEKIAAEKAGIIKENGSVLFGGNSKSVEEVIKAKAAEMGADYHFADKSSLDIVSSDLTGSTFNYLGYKEVNLPLLGLYQPSNAANVLCALEILKAKGFNVSEKAVREGLLAARWPARFEIISRDPLIIFDGAHNPEGIETAVTSIKRYFGDQKVCILTGVMKDKDYNYIAGKFAEIADRAFTITPDNPRALPSEEYAKVLESVGITATSYSSVADALDEAKKYAKETNTALLCLGSLYMYCEVIDKI